VSKREEILREREMLEAQLTPLEREHCRALGFVERAAMLARLDEAVQLHNECQICLDSDDELMVCREILADLRSAEAVFVKEALILEVSDGICA
jgi:hypothetical protein